MRLLPGAVEVMALHDAELPQMDYLCGCFWATLALRQHGFAQVTQDDVGVRAGSSLSNAPDPESFPPGEPGRRDYRHELPTLAPAISGTAPSGLVRAVPAISAGAVEAVPVRGPFATDDLRRLFEAVLELDRPVLVSLNVATRFFWGARPSPRTLVEYLVSGDDAGGPPPDWDVGHLVGAFGLIDGPSGTLVLVGDTYRSLGANATYLQPIERVAASLRRDGLETSGGILVYAASADAAALRSSLAGFDLAVWDNGSPDLGATA